MEIGLADPHRRRGALATASELITPILPRLPSDSANGWDAPLRAYIVCVQILRAAADPGQNGSLIRASSSSTPSPRTLATSACDEASSRPSRPIMSCVRCVLRPRTAPRGVDPWRGRAREGDWQRRMFG